MSTCGAGWCCRGWATDEPTIWIMLGCPSLEACCTVQLPLKL